MEFSIGPQFSREFTFVESRIVMDLNVILNDFFLEKEYDPKIKKIYVVVICVSKGFEPFFTVRTLKIYRKEPAIEYEIKLDFEQFLNADKEERMIILKEEFLNKSKEILNNEKLKKFNIELFLYDLRNCLDM